MSGKHSSIDPIQLPGLRMLVGALGIWVAPPLLLLAANLADSASHQQPCPGVGSGLVTADIPQAADDC
ncbi:hypothetical protein Slala03_21020 [Streptomyces lavendulae subsp. lavendulae]|uniref:hypothetical protein n=1 Tax=Streptomyces lavendulae TaxID=1914 RepID=UPI0024A3EF28|nr:hypothetical protein [Streptomyces lavendulae]GLV82413.1 hypothetical protein Slala03_21020 [Streptomyces lavendulae subsp. lavendulae]